MKLLSKIAMTFVLILTTQAHAITIKSDDRKVLNESKRPWRAIGRISSVSTPEFHCTGTLVGSRLVVTAAHCAPQNMEPLTFTPSYNNPIGFVPAPTRVVKVVRGTTGNKTDPGYNWDDDWAFLVLENRIGFEYGYMSIAPAFGNVNAGQAVFQAVGYPYVLTYGYSKIPSVQTCTIYPKDWLAAILHHDCDMNEGSSGGPLIAMIPSPNGPMEAIVGVHSHAKGADGCTYNDRYCYNGAVDSARFSAKWAELLAYYP